VSLSVDRPARRLSDRRLELAVTPDARARLGERGHDPVYGARRLRRLMQRQIDDNLARSLLAGEIQNGDTVLVDVAPDGQGLMVTKGEVTLGE
jgi:ATP-dependent Clp protease ATP-binding subunit ClpB